MTTQRLSLCLLLLCSACGSSDDGAVVPATDPGEIDPTGEPGETGSGDAGNGDGAGDGSSSGVIDPDGDSSDTGPQGIACGAGEPVFLFGTTDEVGVRPLPSGAGSIWGVQSWRADDGSFAEAAEDFEVPEDTCWCVTSVNVIGQYDMAPETPRFSIAFHADVGGLPDPSPWTSEEIETAAGTPVRTTHDTIDPMSYLAELQTPVLVPPGPAWISMVALGVEIPFGEFSLNLTPAEVGNASTAYHASTNPSCSAWGHYEDCYSQAPHTEVAFEVHGHVASCD